MRKKKYQLNTIVQNFSLPQIFYTWKHLHGILKKTDNNDPLSSNHSFHTYHHYTNRLQSLHEMISLIILLYKIILDNHNN